MYGFMGIANTSLRSEVAELNTEVSNILERLTQLESRVLQILQDLPPPVAATSRDSSESPVPRRRKNRFITARYVPLSEGNLE